MVWLWRAPRDTGDFFVEENVSRGVLHFRDCDETLEPINLMKAKVSFCAEFQRLFSLLQATGGVYHGDRRSGYAHVGGGEVSVQPPYLEALRGRGEVKSQ